MHTTGLQKTRVGTVGAYMAGGSADLIRRVRSECGHVTLSGKAGLRALSELEKQRELSEIDLDPATYCDRDDNPLIPIDWVGRQRDLGLTTIRSAGGFVPARNHAKLAEVMVCGVADDVVRVVSLHSDWLRVGQVEHVVDAFKCNDNHLAVVLADPFDPLRGAEQVDGFRKIQDAVVGSGRRMEFLRSDTHSIPFAATGGTHGAIGLTSSTRHHAQLFNRGKAKRLQSPHVWIPRLMSWHHGVRLGALAPWNGAGCTDCDCIVCDERSLLRFNAEWPRVPDEVRQDAQLHDLSSWAALRDQVLNASDPVSAWRSACRAATKVEGMLLESHKVDALKVPEALIDWS